MLQPCRNEDNPHLVHEFCDEEGRRCTFSCRWQRYRPRFASHRSPLHRHVPCGDGSRRTLDMPFEKTLSQCTELTRWPLTFFNPRRVCISIEDQKSCQLTACSKNTRGTHLASQGACTAHSRWPTTRERCRYLRVHDEDVRWTPSRTPLRRSTRPLTWISCVSCLPW